MSSLIGRLHGSRSAGKKSFREMVALALLIVSIILLFISTQTSPTRSAVPPESLSSDLLSMLVLSTDDSQVARLASATPTPVLPPPLLKSDKYLDDISLITKKPCGPPCFRGITVGQTNFTDALIIIRSDPTFAGVETQINPQRPSWNTAAGEPCCQIVANPDTELIDAIVVKLAPKMITRQLIDTYGPPTYVTTVDYSDQEVALPLIYPEQGVVIWVLTGDPQSSLDPNDPIVALIYLNPAIFPDLIMTATLQGWNGYGSYQTYKNAPPVVTPLYSPTLETPFPIVTITPNNLPDF
jgi:hypothetical protein